MFILLTTSFSVFAEGECTRQLTVYLKDGDRIIAKVPMSYKKESFYIMEAKVPTGKGIFSHVIRYNQGKLYALNRDKYTEVSLTINADTGDFYPLGNVKVDDKGAISIGKGKFTNMSFDNTGNVFHLMLDITKTDACEIEAIAELYVNRLINQGTTIDSNRSVSLGLKSKKITL